MNNKYKMGLQWVVLVTLGLMGGNVGATTWTYSGTGPVSAGGLSASASAISATNATTSALTATTAYYSGGLGVTTAGESTGSPQHAIDNNGAIESVLFSFSDGLAGSPAADRVNLSSVQFGYASGDSDFSVYAYTAAGVANPIGKTYTNLTTNGWALIGHYNGGSSGGVYAINNAVYSSYWLVGAYNGVGGSLSKGNDYFKLASLTGSKCPSTGSLPAGCTVTPPVVGVPEPGTLLLMSAGLFGLYRFSSRRPV